MKILHVMAGAPEGGAETFFLEGALALADGDVRESLAFYERVLREQRRGGP